MLCHGVSDVLFIPTTCVISKSLFCLSRWVAWEPGSKCISFGFSSGTTQSTCYVIYYNYIYCLLCYCLVVLFPWGWCRWDLVPVWVCICIHIHIYIYIYIYVCVCVCIYLCMYKVEFCLSCSDPLICFHSMLCCTFMTINMLLFCCCESTLIFKVDPRWWYIHIAYFCTRHLACIHATATWFSVHNFIIFRNIFVSLSLQNLYQRIVEWRDKFQAHRHWSLISRPSSFSGAWWPRGPNDLEHSVWDQVSYRSWKL